MNDFDINTDKRVGATDALGVLLERLSCAADDRLNPASDVFLELLGEFRDPVERLVEEVPRLVMIEEATRRFLDKLFDPARGCGCYGCGKLGDRHEPGCPLETLEMHL